MRAGGGGAFLHISGITALEAATERPQPWHSRVRGQELTQRPAAALMRVPPTHAPPKGCAPCPPSYPLPRLPIPPSLTLWELSGQPGGVAHGKPAPLMCAGAAVIGQSLVTYGDCGGRGCCGSRSASRGSGSGSPAFKGDAAAGRGGDDGGQVEDTAQTHIVHGPSGPGGLVSRTPEIQGWIRHRVPSNSRLCCLDSPRSLTQEKPKNRCPFAPRHPLVPSAPRAAHPPPPALERSTASWGLQEKLRDSVPFFFEGFFWVTTKRFDHSGQSC